MCENNDNNNKKNSEFSCNGNEYLIQTLFDCVWFIVGIGVSKVSNYISYKRLEKRLKL